MRRTPVRSVAKLNINDQSFVLIVGGETLSKIQIGSFHVHNVVA